ncbi:MAG: hypothetical protein ACREOO_21345 [bacterium]
MRKNILTVLLVLATMLGWQTAHAHHPRDARVEVWTAPCPDDPYDEAHLEVFLRSDARGYITVYQITPYGSVEVLYPLAHHFQQELRPDRVYRLSDLADDVYLYDEEEGQAQIGVIFTPDPVVLAPWLERSFFEAGLVLGRNKIIYAHVDFPRIFARVEANIRIHLGTRCAPSFVVTPVYVRPRVVYRARERDHCDRKPRHHYRKRDEDRRGYGPPSRRAEREPVELERRTYERRGGEMRRVTFPSRPVEREHRPVVVASDPSPRSRRERKEAVKQSQSRLEEKRGSSPRRDRGTRADD